MRSSLIEVGGTADKADSLSRGMGQRVWPFTLDYGVPSNLTTCVQAYSPRYCALARGCRQQPRHREAPPSAYQARWPCQRASASPPLHLPTHLPTPPPQPGAQPVQQPGRALAGAVGYPGVGAVGAGRGVRDGLRRGRVRGGRVWGGRDVRWQEGQPASSPGPEGEGCGQGFARAGNDPCL